MSTSEPTHQGPDAYPPEALANAVVATRRRLFDGLDVAAEARALGLDRETFDRLSEALDIVEAAARGAVFEKAPPP